MRYERNTSASSRLVRFLLLNDHDGHRRDVHFCASKELRPKLVQSSTSYWFVLDNTEVEIELRALSESLRKLMVSVLGGYDVVYENVK